MKLVKKVSDTELPVLPHCSHEITPFSPPQRKHMIARSGTEPGSTNAVEKPRTRSPSQLAAGDGLTSPSGYHSVQTGCRSAICPRRVKKKGQRYSMQTCPALLATSLDP